MELYISDHPLDCLTCAANGNCELQTEAGDGGAARCALRLRGRQPPRRQKGRVESLFQLRSGEMHRLHPLHSRVRGSPGNLRADHRRARLGSRVSAGQNGALPRIGMRILRRLRPGVPDRDAHREVGDRHRPAGTFGGDDLRLLRRRLQFKAEMRGEEVVRMVPYKDGKANHGHSCVKGRFAWGYATHKDRILKPMIRAKITDPWREVSWEEAIGYAASEFKRIQAEYGRDPSAASHRRAAPTKRPTSSRNWFAPASATTTSIPARGSAIRRPAMASRTAFGTSAGTQDFDSVDETDVVMMIGANPTDAHPVFASRMKQRLREGAKLIVLDPRRIDLVRMPHVEADYHLPLQPGTNVAVLTALAHVIVTEGLVNEDFRARTLRLAGIPGLGGVCIGAAQ